MWRCLTHWGRVTHLCINKLNIIGSANGLSPGWHQVIFWTNAGILSTEPLGTNFSEMFTFHLKKTCENAVCEMMTILSRAHVLSYEAYEDQHNEKKLCDAVPL